MAYHKEASKALLTAKRLKLLRYLKAHPCVDCGTNEISLLEFDHVKGKKVTAISNLVRSNYSWSKIRDEIAKCEVRCITCHRRKTAERGNWYNLLSDEAVNPRVAAALVKLDRRYPDVA